MEQRIFKTFGVFLLVLIVLKFFFRLNISIVGSLVLTVIVWIVMTLLDRQ